ncbi:MAG: acyltransferase [Prevotella sp.]|nr:acyltransferase [Prevotella sp.]
MGRERIISFLKGHPVLMDVVSFFYNIFHSWSFIKYGIIGPLSCRGAFLNHVKIDIKGRGCKVSIGRRSRLNHCVLTLRGDSCVLVIKGGTTMINHTLLDMYRDHSSIIIGSSFSMEGGQIEAMDGKAITIGNNCMFSRDVSICNGDNHPIYVVGQPNEQVNLSADVSIGNHVWIGFHARVLKGVHIVDDVIIGSNALVTKSVDIPHSVYVGCPAKIIKQGVTWRRS